MGWYAHGRAVPGKPFKFDPNTHLSQPHAYEHLLEADTADPRLLEVLAKQHAAAVASQGEHENRHMDVLEKALTDIIAGLGGDTAWDVEVRGRAAAENAPDDYVNGHLEVIFNQARLSD